MCTAARTWRQARKPHRCTSIHVHPPCGSQDPCCGTSPLKTKLTSPGAPNPKILLHLTRGWCPARPAPSRCSTRQRAVQLSGSGAGSMLFGRTPSIVSKWSRQSSLLKGTLGTRKKPPHGSAGSPMTRFGSATTQSPLLADSPPSTYGLTLNDRSRREQSQTCRGRGTAISLKRSFSRSRPNSTAGRQQ